MLYFIKDAKTSVVHSRRCRHVKNLPLCRIGWVESLDEAFAMGLRPCRHCSAVAAKYREEHSELLRICSDCAMSIHLGINYLRVITTRSMWRIASDGDDSGLLLYHRNDRATKHDLNGIMTGYHLQRDCLSDSLVEYLRYIDGHDRFRDTNPPRYHRSKPKSPPKPGTKRYEKQERRRARQERSRSIRRVMTLLEELKSSEARDG